MTQPMTTRERIARMYAHQQADRVPVTDSPWEATLERWRAEGMPADASYVDYFGLDHITVIGVDNSPRYPVETLEQTDEYRVHTTAWGATLKDWKHARGVPQFLDFRIKDPDSWREAKTRMTPSRDRIPWDWLEREYKAARERGDWIIANLWFGFDVTHSWTIGTERMLYALVEEPEWCVDIFNTMLDCSTALLDVVWDAGYTFDSAMWHDDMGFKHNQFFSLRTYRQLLKPAHRRAIEWAHAKGIKAHLHSCGDIRPFVPELVEIGVDCLNPIEVKAGMDPIQLKHDWGDWLVLHGASTPCCTTTRKPSKRRCAASLPIVKENGGYIFSSDHSVPSSVSLRDFQRIVELAKQLGKY